MNIYRFSWWSLAPVALNAPWIWAIIWVLQVYTAHKEVAGEVWLLPTGIWALSGLPMFATAFLGITNVRRSKDGLRGQWVAVVGLILWASFPLSGLFWGDLIRLVQGR